ncbi:MAG TPA: SGNH/GDSL hydrolase family protein [Clostridia bacterium]
MEVNNKVNNAIIVACLGSSTTASKGTFNWIKELEKRPQNKQFNFVNLGVGGDLAYSALQRVSKVISCHPDKIIILIGANDILAQVFKNVRHFFTGWKRLPKEPSPEWFSQNLQTIVRRLKEETSAETALVSLAEVGESPDSANPIQYKLNMLFKQYNEIIKKVAQDEKVSYISFYEQFHEQIVASPGHAFTNFSFLSFYRDYVLREFILHYSFDEIAKMNGWKFHIDGVHLNSRGGMILTNLIQDFLDS